MTTIEAVRKAQQEAHRLAKQMQEAEHQLTAAQVADEKARQARRRSWARAQIDRWDADVAEGLASIESAKAGFNTSAVTDLPRAITAYIQWMAERAKLYLAWQDQQAAVTELEEPRTGRAAAQVTNPVGSYQPTFDKALSDAVSRAVSEQIDALEAERQAKLQALHDGEA